MRINSKNLSVPLPSAPLFLSTSQYPPPLLLYFFLHLSLTRSFSLFSLTVYFPSAYSLYLRVLDSCFFSAYFLPATSSSVLLSPTHNCNLVAWICITACKKSLCRCNFHLQFLHFSQSDHFMSLPDSRPCITFPGPTELSANSNTAGDAVLPSCCGSACFSFHLFNCLLAQQTNQFSCRAPTIRRYVLGAGDEINTE